MICSPPGSSVHGDSPGKDTGMGCHALLQGIFQTQELNPGLLHCRWILYHLSHQRSPRILEWVVYPFSRGTFQPRNWTRVSCIAGGFFNIWATREAFDYWFSFPTYNSAETFFFFITQSWWSGVLVAHSCLTLCDPVHCSRPGSSVHGIFPGRNTDVDYHPFLFFCVIQLDGI